MTNRVVHIEMDEKTLVDVDGLNRGLRGLALNAEDSFDLEGLLNNAIQSLFMAQPDGQANYGGNNPAVGRISLNRFNAHREGISLLEYSPAGAYKGKWGYIQAPLGFIDLREKTYSVNWSDEASLVTRSREDYYRIPEVVMRDTIRVMDCLGLADRRK